MRAAANVGTAFHDLAEKLTKNEDVMAPANRRLYKMLVQFEAWRHKNALRVTHTELHVVSTVYKYQGTLDAIGYLAHRPKVLCLFDWKTGSGIYSDMALQLVAYAQAYFEQTGVWIKRGIIVHVSKDKPHHTLTLKEYTLDKRLLNKFLKRLKTYREFNDPVIVRGARA